MKLTFSLIYGSIVFLATKVAVINFTNFRECEAISATFFNAFVTRCCLNNIYIFASFDTLFIFFIFERSLITNLANLVPGYRPLFEQDDTLLPLFKHFGHKGVILSEAELHTTIIFAQIIPKRLSSVLLDLGSYVNVSRSGSANPSPIQPSMRSSP